MGKKQTLVFDLDDTLIDTYGQLIVPLEKAAVALAFTARDPGYRRAEVYRALLRARRADPQHLVDIVQARFPDFADDLIAARKSVFRDFSVAGLSIDPAVVALLNHFAEEWDLVLLTEGNETLQNRKIDVLNLRALFNPLFLVNGPGAKEKALAGYIEGKSIPARSVVVVGNRLDREILSGIRLGTKTVWVRRGEGAALATDTLDYAADYTISRVAELPDAIGKIGVS